MNEEEFSILLLFNETHPALSAQDISLLTGKSVDVVAGTLAYFVKKEYLVKALGFGNDNDRTITMNSRLELTYAGRRAIQEYRKSSHKQFWMEFRAWATFAVAVAAFALSVIALVLQQR